MSYSKSFKVSSSILLKNLAYISGVIATNPTLPILETCLFILDRQSLSIVGTNLETRVQTHLAVDSEDQVKFCVPIKTLLEGLRNFSEQPLSIKVQEDTLSIEVVHATGVFHTLGQDAASFPSEHIKKDSKKFNIPSNALLDGINRTLFATANDELRPAMGGVHFEFEADFIRFVATDGHRLARFTNNNVKNEHAATCTVPKKPLNVLKSLLKDEDTVMVLHITPTDLFADFQYEEEVNGSLVIFQMQMSCRLMSGTFPNYASIIPTVRPYTAVIDRSALLQALKRGVYFANKASHMVQFSFSKDATTLQLSAEDRENSHASKEFLPFEYKGENLVLGFNGRYLIEMLSVLSGNNVHMVLNNTRVPILLYPEEQVEGEELLTLILPLLIPGMEEA